MLKNLKMFYLLNTMYINAKFIYSKKYIFFLIIITLFLKSWLFAYINNIKINSIKKIFFFT